LTQVDVDLLESIASQVAVALLNARSYAESESRANREILINQINSKILRTTRVEQALQVAIREVGRAVDAQRTSILLDIESNDANGHS
jgi:GAF domain-containing protein